MPRHKGKVEAAVKYAQNNAVAGRTFTSLGEQNLFLAEWERTVADTRIHGATRQQVGKLFMTAEQPALRPLPAMVFPVFEEAPRTVHRDGPVEFRHAYYSAPPEYVGRKVWVRRETRLVRLYNVRDLDADVWDTGHYALDGRTNCECSPKRKDVNGRVAETA